MSASVQSHGYVNDEKLTKDMNSTLIIGTDLNYKHEVVWKNAIGFLFLHLLGLWGIFLMLTGAVQLKTILYGFIVLYTYSEGITIGAHRLYTHRCFKATPLLRAILILLQTGAGQNSMFIWCRDHRLHHRYSDTDADPHNAKRGFFFSHIGWLMTKKHPYVIELGKKIDMSDLKADWMVMLQKKYYYYLYFFIAVLLPVWAAVHFLGEPWLEAFLVVYCARYILQLNGTWLVNSAAHIYGTRPYDKNLQPVESWFVSFISLGEGWHNYHHTFPWDYKAAELSTHFNASAQIIEFLASIGMAYDLKTATPDMVKSRIKRTGDGTHNELGNEESRNAVKVSYVPFHPLNPSYTVTYEDPPASLKVEGLPLYHENDIFDCGNVTITKNIGSN
ncbi:unnamed protein product [Diatraea saccharalis]|uniref:Fatty acid desaturase domain-containing protein n=1 Tax=Diatraea saccharalis TaxID=40085 RepID=A0A9N9WCE1_9NEOP|nr:unnamed protein product [Diatraea saccharalis]